MRSHPGPLLIQAQLVVAAAMTGIIWFVQRITYPQFLVADATSFASFHAHYTSRLTPIVAPLMIAELALALGSVWFFRRSRVRGLILLGAVLVAALWLTTFLVQVPLHEQLAEGWSAPVVRKLVDSNWFRTILWSVRLGLLLLIASRLRPDEGGGLRDARS
ncbi:MAG: hypothetical protein HKN82_03915 [Akkermansiaceae bacterium]|nr:hypothetical protein [Akkermansiaceae bacterium]NNM29644.1 hypothetical protein [Akkermansiaceae bacterium]